MFGDFPSALPFVIVNFVYLGPAVLGGGKTFMQFTILFLVLFGLIHLVDNGDAHSEKEVQKETGFSQSPVAPTQSWTQIALVYPTAQSGPHSLETPQPRPAIHQAHQDGRRKLPMALLLWETQWEETQQLSRLQEALELRCSTLQCSQVPEGFQSRFEVPAAVEAVQLGLESNQTDPQRRPQRKCETKEGEGKRQEEQRDQHTTLAVCSAINHPSLAYTRNCDESATGTDLFWQCCYSYHELGTPFCCEEDISGHFPGTRGYQEGSGESRQSVLQRAVKGPQQGLASSGQSSQAASVHQRGQIFPQTELAETPSGLREELANTVAAVQGSAERIWSTTGHSSTTAEHSQEESPTTEQAGCRSWGSDLGRCRGNLSRDLRGRGKPCLRERSSSACASGTGKPTTEHSCSGRFRRTNGNQFRWRSRSSFQETQIDGALRWTQSRRSTGLACFLLTQAVIFGSDAACLRNEPREPFFYEKAPDFANAYQVLPEHGAASDADLRPFSITAMIRCHSIHWEPTFVSEPVAIGNATLLRNEVLSTWPQPTPLSSRFDGLRVRSSFKKLTTTAHKRVRFVPFAEVIESYYPPRVEPHRDCDELIAEMKDFSFDHDHDDEVQLMARAPRRLPTSSSSPDPDDEVHTPTSPSSFDDSIPWRSVQVHDLQANVGRGRIRLVPREARFAEARRLLGYSHHEVAEIFLVQPSPQDLLSLNVMPLLLLRHEDLRFGDHRKAVLIDVELHGTTFESPVETDRFTLLLPSPIHRSLLLQVAGVAKYCQAVRNRCLLWHQGQLVRQQSNGLIALNHGDYVRVAVPPFPAPEVSTYYAVRACQHGLSPIEIADRYNRNPDPDDLFTDHEPEQTDEQVGLQLSTCRQESPTRSLTTKQVAVEIATPHCSGIPLQRLRSQGEAQPPQFNSVAPGYFPPHHQREDQDAPWASWFEMLHSAFTEHAATTCEEE